MIMIHLCMDRDMICRPYLCAKNNCYMHVKFFGVRFRFLATYAVD